jgi:transcriptional regulator with XRE-family HTH domain
MVSQAEIGQRIRQARERIDMSQREFSDAVGKDQTSISLCEAGKRKVSATELSTFAQVLSVPISYFYEGEIQTDALDQMILDEVRQLPTSDAKETMLQVVRAFSTFLRKHSSPE